MIKICVITTIDITMTSFVVPAMRRFLQKGYDVTLICNMSDEFYEKYSGEFHCINIPMKRGISISDMLTMPFRFYNIFRREKFDYVQYATTNASWNAAFPAWLARIPVRLYCQWGLHYIAYTGFKRTVFRTLEKILSAFSTHVTSPSRKNLQFAISEKLFPASKGSMIGDGGTVGVDFTEFDYTQREHYRKEILKEYPQLEGKKVFGYLGRIETDKGINELLEAFFALDDPSCALFLIGPFDKIRSGFKKEIIDKAKASPNVIFHGFTREVPRYLSIVDVLVHPTYREGFSMALQQAMAMGCAIVTTDIPGPSEVVEDGVSGLLVPDHDSAALAAAMKKVKDSPELYTSLVKASLERVHTLFNRERMVELTLKNREDMMRSRGLIR